MHTDCKHNIPYLHGTMAVKGIVVAVFVVVVAFLAYEALQPIPDDVADSPWTMKKFMIQFKILLFMGQLMPSGLNDWLDQRARAGYRESGPSVPYKDEVFDRVQVRVFADEPAGGKTVKRPAIVFYHGGGWVSGNLDVYHGYTATFARQLNAVVVSVDYLLAPKHPFPAAIDDCTAATVWFLKHLSDYNVDPARVAIMGDSAGGNLAAALAQRLTCDPQYQDLPKVKLQVLIYPCLQAFDFQTPSYQHNGDYDTLLLTRSWVVMLLDWYLHGYKASPRTQGAMMTNNHTSAAAKRSSLVQKCLSHDLIPNEYKKATYKAPSTDFGNEGIYDGIKEALLNPDFAPLMREDLRGLPEAYILTAEYDVLRDDGIMYAKRLEKAGVRATLMDYMKGYHGMFSYDKDEYPLATPLGYQSFVDFIHFAKQNL